MGDYGRTSLSSEAQIAVNPAFPSTESDEISVLVTGFGPFKTNLVNASHLIASSLPSSFTIPSTKSSPASPDGSLPATRRVSIHVHPTPIPVAYSTVGTTVPAMIEEFARAHGGRRPDIVIHIGIAATRAYYSVETKAHRDSYHMSDINGRPGYEDGEKLWRELSLPPVLRAGRSTDPVDWTETAVLPTGKPIDLISEPSQVETQSHSNPRPPNEKFLSLWQSLVPETDVRISEDAGRYLCEFIFYTSLALAYQQGQDRNVVFFHVPGAHDDKAIQTGRDVTIALIKALVTYWMDREI